MVARTKGATRGRAGYQCAGCGCTEWSACIEANGRPCLWVLHPVEDQQDGVCSACAALTLRALCAMWRGGTFGDEAGGEKEYGAAWAILQALGDIFRLPNGARARPWWRNGERDAIKPRAKARR